MGAKSYQVTEVARMAKVTVRTLHYYDEIGLLRPSGRTAAGYRLYNHQDLLRLHQVLICRALGLPLAQIGRMLDNPAFDRRAALLRQQQQLKSRLRDTQGMLRSVEAALKILAGEMKMDAGKIFGGFDPAEHEQEAKERWGQTDAYQTSAKRTAAYKPADWQRIKAEGAAVMNGMAAAMATGAAADEEPAMELAERHRLHIDRWFYPCPHAMHGGLAEMYLADDRFKATFEKVAPGLAKFFAAAIRANNARR